MEATKTESEPIQEPKPEGSKLAISITSKAAEAARKQLAKRSTPGGMIRLGIRGSGCSGFSYVIEFEDKEPRDRDRVFEQDGVKFVVVSGGPHEVAFDLDVVPAETKPQLIANMPNGANGRSPLLSVAQETWTLSLGGLRPGKYPFVSTPRLPQGMKGEIQIQ